MPIERRGADAALRYGFRATRWVFEGAHTAVHASSAAEPIKAPASPISTDLLVAAVAPLREDDRPFARPWAGKDRHLEAAIIVSPTGRASRREFGDPRTGMRGRHPVCSYLANAAAPVGMPYG